MVFLLPTEWCDYPREGSSEKTVGPLKVIGQLSCDSMVHLGGAYPSFCSMHASSDYLADRDERLYGEAGYPT